MTKQVFDQIAEGLREAAETPPAWAMEKAREIWAAMGFVNDRFEHSLVIARAIVEVDKAATERAALWHENEAYMIEMEAHRKRGARAKTRQPMWHRRAAAAIRKGAGYG